MSWPRQWTSWFKTGKKNISKISCSESTSSQFRQINFFVQGTQVQKKLYFYWCTRDLENDSAKLAEALRVGFWIEKRIGSYFISEPYPNPSLCTKTICNRAIGIDNYNNKSIPSECLWDINWGMSELHSRLTGCLCNRGQAAGSRAGINSFRKMVGRGRISCGRVHPCTQVPRVEITVVGTMWSTVHGFGSCPSWRSNGQRHQAGQDFAGPGNLIFMPMVSWVCGTQGHTKLAFRLFAHTRV